MGGLVSIEGSWGEGGGQILRTSLTLSLLTGRPLHIWNIRAGRPKPGLRAQHLVATRAAATVCGGEVTGDEVGSTEVRLVPKSLSAGRYHFRIATAGAASLVLQTIVPALGLAGGDSTVTVVGGTHVPWAPTFDYLARHWAQLLKRLGLTVRLVLERAGFFPKGGGIVRAEIAGGWSPKAMTATERGELINAGGVSLVGGLPRAIAARQAGELERGLFRLGFADAPARPAIDILEPPAVGAGTAVFVEVVFSHGRGAFTALGRPGKPAEQVGREAVAELSRFLKTDAAFDYHLADQLLLPLALADGDSRFTTSAVSEHLLTNAHVVNLFLGEVVRVEGEVGKPGTVRVSPSGTWKSAPALSC